MEKIEVKGFFFLVIFLILMHNNSITQGTSILTLTQGARYDYAVLCTDYCGSKIWDATNLEADLYFYITSIDKIKDDISIYTRYNSTPVIEKPDDSDYGIFSLNETYSYSSRESKTESGKFLWQWSRLETELRCSIPTFFLLLMLTQHLKITRLYFNAHQNLKKLK